MQTPKNNFTINHLLPSTVSSSFPFLLHTNHLKIRHCVLSFCCCQGPKGQCYCGFSRAAAKMVHWAHSGHVPLSLSKQPSRLPLGCQVAPLGTEPSIWHTFLLHPPSLLLQPLRQIFVLHVVAVFICGALSVCDWCESLQSVESVSVDSNALCDGIWGSLLSVAYVCNGKA